MRRTTKLAHRLDGKNIETITPDVVTTQEPRIYPPTYRNVELTIRNVELTMSDHPNSVFSEPAATQNENQVSQAIRISGQNNRRKSSDASTNSVAKSKSPDDAGSSSLEDGTNLFFKVSQ